MAYYNLRYNELASRHYKRGRIIQCPPAAYDPLGPTVYVECAKHLKTVSVNNQIAAAFDTAVDEAFDRCPGCTDERQARKTRWPEGAEL